MQNKLQTRGLIQIISQLPDKSIIRINNQSIRNDYIFNLIKDYEIKFNFSTCIYPSGVFIQVDKSNMQIFIQILENVNVSKYLIDSEYFACQETYWEPLAAVYKGLFCISDKIKLSEEFITQCEENDIDVMFVEMPTANSWNYKKHNGMTKYAKELGIPFVDLNTTEGKNAINWKKDTRDGGRHLNCYGAKKVTREIGKYISENYTFTNKKKDPEYKSWNKSYKEYKQFMKTDKKSSDKKHKKSKKADSKQSDTSDAKKQKTEKTTTENKSETTTESTATEVVTESASTEATTTQQ